MKVQIHCPFCEETYDLDEFPEGAHTKCEKCGQEFVIDMSVVGPGAKQAKPASSQPPKAVPVPPAPKPPVSPGWSPAREMNDELKNKPAKTVKADNEGFKPPLIAQVFKGLAMVTFLVTVFCLVAAGAAWAHEGFSMYPLFPVFVSLFSGIVMLGFGELAAYIGEIRYHAIRQTELLVKIAER